MYYFDSFNCQFQCEDYFCGIPCEDDNQYFLDFSDEQYENCSNAELEDMLDEI